MTANRDGDLDQLDVRGVLTLRIADPASAQICFKIRANDDSAIQFKTHPNVDKFSFKQEHSIQMKDLSRPFPVNQNLEVVRWKFTSQDDTDVPLTGKIELTFGRENVMIDFGYSQLLAISSWRWYLRCQYRI